MRVAFRVLFHKWSEWLFAWSEWLFATLAAHARQRRYAAGQIDHWTFGDMRGQVCLLSCRRHA
jgi:hypothetical protein